jgi:uncharacterized protein YkwD
LKVKIGRVLAISFSILFLLSTLTFGVTDLAQGGKYGEITPTEFELELLNKINENRTENGVAPLKLNATLMWAARAHSQDMIDYDFFDHISSEEGQFDGATFQERVNNYAEYESGYVGECIAWKSWGIDVEWTMSSWKNSPPHWDIIINPNFREIGIGLLEGDWDGYSDAGLHTVDFGGHATSVDLSISNVDLGFDPASPYEGENVNISITVRNKGTTDAHPVLVKFYDGNPQSGGTLIGTEQVPQILIHGEDAMVNLVWDTSGKAGDHEIYVVVDPEDLIAESNEGNNIAFKTLTVNIPNSPIALNYGWNLVSFPYLVTDTNIENVLGSIDGEYDRVQVYDPTQSRTQWLNYNILKPSDTNLLSHLDNRMGFWIHVTESNGADMIITGDAPVTSHQIDLKAGWNLVGYPSTSIRLRDNALNNLEFGVEVEMIQGFDSINKIHETLGPADSIEPEQGYFILANYDCQWVVNP